jgi:protein-S-isoprenylcysteine O-methyltransferase Ste14
MKLIPEARKAWRFLSMQIPALNLAFLGTWAVLPQKFQDALSPPWVVGIAVFLIAAGMLGRLVKQEDKP